MPTIELLEFLAPFVPWLVGVSVISLLLGALLAPLMILRIPSDYFLPERRARLTRHSRHPALRALILAAKNLIGALLLVAGLAMLFLPGQGLLTLLAGLIVMNYPGKYRFERWLVRRPYVLSAMNWLRVRRGRRPLVAP
ncbi:MAG TPA: PGPGW domain-containing protein [Gammaproteobacteria bacterium]